MRAFSIFWYCFQRRERDSNPRRLSPQRFSRPPHSTALPSLRRKNRGTGSSKKKILKNYFIISPKPYAQRVTAYLIKSQVVKINCKNSKSWKNVGIMETLKFKLICKNLTNPLYFKKYPSIKLSWKKGNQLIKNNKAGYLLKHGLKIFLCNQYETKF